MQKFKSDKSIGEEVHFDENGWKDKPSKVGKVVAVTFTEAQVFYDIKDILDLQVYERVYASCVSSKIKNATR